MTALPPGSTIGVLGGGQLGRMLALEAHRMGYRIHVYDPTPDGPAAQVAGRQTNAAFEDEKALQAFFDAVDAVTFEFENIPAAALEKIRGTPLHPRVEVLKICQDRLLEKEFVVSQGVAVADFTEVRSAEDVRAFLAEHGAGVIKTARSGYDGKGQCKVDAHGDVDKIWSLFDGKPAVIERLVAFEAEVSVLCARDAAGATRVFPVAHNVHANHILDVTTVPAPLAGNLARYAAQTAEKLAAGLRLVGVLCVEMFLEDGRLLVNELAPRPHNSGHYSLDFCATSQFEQQLRAVAGLPLGDPALRVPFACMANLMGDLWEKGEPRWEALLVEEGVRLHLYGKTAAKPGRKMGHLTAAGATRDQAVERARRARQRL